MVNQFDFELFLSFHVSLIGLSWRVIVILEKFISGRPITRLYLHVNQKFNDIPYEIGAEY